MLITLAFLNDCISSFFKQIFVFYWYFTALPEYLIVWITVKKMFSTHIGIKTCMHDALDLMSDAKVQFNKINKYTKQ